MQSVKIGIDTYQISNAFTVLLDYVSCFGSSYLAANDKNPAASLLNSARLVWCAIRGERRDFSAFLDDAISDDNFAATARYVREAVFVHPLRSGEPVTDSDAELCDELDVLQLIISAGIPVSLVDKLPMHMLLDLVRRKLDAPHKSEIRESIYATPQNIASLKSEIRGR